MMNINNNELTDVHEKSEDRRAERHTVILIYNPYYPDASNSDPKILFTVSSLLSGRIRTL